MSIKVGDLVVVTRGGCDDTWVGYVFEVAEIHPSRGICPNCKTQHGYGGAVLTAYEAGDPRGFEIPRLKRIPPLSELESEQRKEEISA